MYAHLYVRVQRGPYRGAYVEYLNATSYEVLEDRVQEEGQAGDTQSPSGGLGTGEDLHEGDRPDTTNQSVPDGQAQKEGAVSELLHTDDVRPGADTDSSGMLQALEDLTPREPWDVTCDRCGRTVSVNHATPEEGDEWECHPCNDYHNLKERSDRQDETTPRQLPLL